MKYQYLVVGSGLFGSTFARQMTDAGRKVLVIEKENHVAGHCHTEIKEGVVMHCTGPHLFHTKYKHVWDFVNKFSEFNHYHHQVKANYNNTALTPFNKLALQPKILSLPFNLMTYHQLWGCTTPEEAKRELGKRKIHIENPQNLEEWCLSQIGEELYYTLVYHYTKKQWMREPRELPASIIKRLPLRMTYNDWYFDDPYQGVPMHGYTPMIEKMLDGIEVRLNSDFFDGWKNWKQFAEKLVFTGSIDEYYDYCFGELEYLTLDFQHVVRDGNFQGIGQMNYTGEGIVYTRVVEHKHFYFAEDLPKTVVTYEFPIEWDRSKPRYYPVNDVKNMTRYEQYRQLDSEVLFGGRLGSYVYANMDNCVEMAIEMARKEINHVG